MTGTSGQIGSPMYPNQYQHNSEYAWTITVPTGMRILITFSTLDIQMSYRGACRADYVVVSLGHTVKPVYKDHPWECNNMVFVHWWSLIAESFMQKMSNWETKSVVAIEIESLFLGVL